LHLQVRALVGFSPCAYRGFRNSLACARHSSTVPQCPVNLLLTCPGSLPMPLGINPYAWNPPAGVLALRSSSCSPQRKVKAPGLRSRRESFHRRMPSQSWPCTRARASMRFATFPRPASSWRDCGKSAWMPTERWAHYLVSCRVIC